MLPPDAFRLQWTKCISLKNAGFMHSLAFVNNWVFHIKLVKGFVAQHKLLFVTENLDHLRPRCKNVFQNLIFFVLFSFLDDVGVLERK